MGIPMKRQIIKIKTKILKMKIDEVSIYILQFSPCHF